MNDAFLRRFVHGLKVYIVNFGVGPIYFLGVDLYIFKRFAPGGS